MGNKKRKFLHYFFLNLICGWAFLINVLFFLMFIPEYVKWITSYGMFFLPWLITLWFVWILLYIFKFRNPTLQDLKKLNSSVYHNENMLENDNDKISKNIAIAITNQREHERNIELEKAIHENKLLKEKEKIMRETIENLVEK